MHYHLDVISMLYTVHSNPENFKKETIPRHSARIGWYTNVTSTHASKAITWPFYFDASVLDHLCTLNHLAEVFIFFQSEDYFSVSKNIFSVWTVCKSRKEKKMIWK